MKSPVIAGRSGMRMGLGAALGNSPSGRLRMRGFAYRRASAALLRASARAQIIPGLLVAVIIEVRRVGVRTNVRSQVRPDVHRRDRADRHGDSRSRYGHLPDDVPRPPVLGRPA